MPDPRIFSVEQYEAEQCELESAAIIQRGQKALAEFQSWAREERRCYSESNRQTRIVIDETRNLLGLSRSTRSGAQREQLDDGPDARMHEAPLSFYRAQFFRHDGTVLGVEEFFAENDAAAMVRANRDYRSGIGIGFQISENDRHVHTEHYR